MARFSAALILRLSTGLLLLVWAGFWTWFIVVSMLSSGGEAYVHGGRLLAAVLVPAITSLIWPRVGGALLVIVGAVFAWRFPLLSTQVILALPPVLIGALSLATPRRVRAAA